MVNAIVLINVDRGRINDTAETLADMKEISEVYSVGGRFDLAAIIRVKTNEELADTVTKRIASLNAVRDTETLIAFRAFSRHNLEAMFSVGLEQ